MPIIWENENEFWPKALNELLVYLKPLFDKAAKLAENRVKLLVREALTTAPEYHSLLPGGSLYGQVGNPNIENDLNVIINTIVEHISLDSQLNSVNIGFNRIVALFQLNIIRADFQEILDLPEASFTTEKGSVLPWLRWLILDGPGAQLILEYEYLPFTPQGHVSRTNTGIMIFAQDSFWTLPEYAGTQGDNWITRSMSKISDIIVDTIEQTFMGEFN